MSNIAIYGAEGFGREVLPMVRAGLAGQSKLVFVDDQAELQGTKVNGHEVLSFENAVADGFAFVLAIANGAIRRKLTSKISAAGAQLSEARAPGVVIYDDVKMGAGALLCEHVTITSNVRIGNNFHANIYSYIAHDCVIGDYVTFAPRVSCNGRVEIGDDVYVGTGALIRQGVPGKPLRIGAGAIVGMGAVVTKDVPAGATVIGNPARIMDKKA